MGKLVLVFDVGQKAHEADSLSEFRIAATPGYKLQITSEFGCSTCDVEAKYGGNGNHSKSSQEGK